MLKEDELWISWEMVQMRSIKVSLALVKYQENEEQFQLQNFVLELLFQFKKILDGRTVHSCNLPLVWNCRSRKRSVTFLSYRLWFEKLRFLVPRIICTWQAWFVPVICGGNHSFALRAVQSAPCWAASRMPGVHPSAESPEIMHCQSTLRNITVSFRSKH